jgi:endo-1,4-beta-mannosidase
MWLELCETRADGRLASSQNSTMDRRDFLIGALSVALAPKALHKRYDFAFSDAKIGANRLNLKTHRFGVTYTPTKNWFYVWNDFDKDQVARDLDGIAALGCDHLRMMLLWPDFQPNRTWVSPAHLVRLHEFMTLCEKRNLEVQLCMLNGFVSGMRFVPSYVFGHSSAEFYEMQSIRQAQELYFREVGRVADSHRNFMGFDLANEIPNAWSTGEHTEIGDAWCEALLNLCDTVSPGKVHVNGAWGQWFFKDTFSSEFMAKRPIVAIMHCYGRYAGAPGKLLDSPTIQLPAATAALIRAYANDQEKPVWCQEFGVSDTWNSEAEIVSFLEKTTLAGISGGVNWFTWWCSHDLNPTMEFDSDEYRFGLITNGGKLKPQGKVFKQVADAYRGKPVQMPMNSPPLRVPPSTYDETWKWLLDWIREHPTA